jgi:hypothetical protein
MFLTQSGPSFRSSERLISTVQQLLCASLLSNCTSLQAQPHTRKPPSPAAFCKKMPSKRSSTPKKLTFVRAPVASFACTNAPHTSHTHTHVQWRCQPSVVDVSLQVFLQLIERFKDHLKVRALAIGLPFTFSGFALGFMDRTMPASPPDLQIALVYFFLCYPSLVFMKAEIEVFVGSVFLRLLDSENRQQRLLKRFIAHSPIVFNNRR